MTVTTDHLVVGAGVSGLAFTDALVGATDVDVVVVDRRTAPGGHWGDAYPFVVLHSPSAYYGVDSLPLGQDRIDLAGPNAGLYERATGPEVVGYLATAAERLVATGRVRLLLGHEHLGGEGSTHRVRDLRTGQVREMQVRRRVVDARYQEASVPATHNPSYDVAADAPFVPVGRLPEVLGASSYVVLGAGKTAVDACLWLLEQGVEPDRITWVRARDAWFLDRASFQPLDQVGGIMAGLAADAEALATATDLPDLVDRLEAAGRLLRLDPEVPATMLRGGMLSRHELTELRRVTDVVRLGRVRRVEAARVLLDRGDLPLAPGSVVVDCTAYGLRDAPGLPVFGPGRIVLQQVRHLSPSFNAALIGVLEARGDDDEAVNRLCTPNPYSGSVASWPDMLARTWATESLWLRDAELSSWVGGTRLNLLRALPDHLHEPAAREAVGRYLTHVGGAVARWRPASGQDTSAPPGSRGTVGAAGG